MNIKDLYQKYSKNYLIATDTRNIRKNALFFSLKGAHFNGNTFAKKAIELGASYAIIDEKSFASNNITLLLLFCIFTK